MSKQAVVGAIVAVLFLAGPMAGIAAAQEQKELVKIAVDKKLGKYLTNSNGRALYYYKKDGPGKSECTGSCTQTWPVYCYTAEEISLSRGLKQSDFVSFHRTDNDQDHLAYKGMPLYNFAGDKKPGDRKGHGMDGLWFLVKP
ncbi:MAG: hypothetical protein OEW15_01825 [Nitrospirota bacterium]|nr:hypothetical protein [Nitrospirota bacterium]